MLLCLQDYVIYDKLDIKITTARSTKRAQVVTSALTKRSAVKRALASSLWQANGCTSIDWPQISWPRYYAPVRVVC